MMRLGQHVCASAAARKAKSRRWSWCVLTLLAVVLCAALAATATEQGRPTEYEVKAVYLFNFGKFVRWPPELRLADAFYICVLGRDPFGPILDGVLAGETIEGTVLRVRRITAPREAAQCRIVFISASEEFRLPRLLADLHGMGILTVSDLPRFSDRGGAIGFVMEGERVRFEVNRQAAAQAGITLSSELLRVAASVRPEQPLRND